jgi:nitrogen regulatory protein P-II 1
MKQLVLIIHNNLKQDAADLFHRIKQIQGFTFSGVEGHGAQSGADAFLSDRDKVVGYTSHTRVDLLLKDIDVDGVLAELRKSKMGLHGQGIYWITTVEQSGRL